jgi:isovaleryl-CoA dehydrogenase
VLRHACSRLGSLWALLERTRRLAYYAAAEIDRGNAAALPAVLSAKAEVADCCVQLTNEAMTLAGGVAYGDNAVLARLLRDARAAHVMAPTTDLLRLWVGRSLLGEPLLGEGDE